ncbi:HAMP domain-containing sensor histidine kinase [uncultured Eubacterium sp.]|uniref:HAMP domain-containing sensor histidine kinase n=1 Tax=uncultured Eubacterium sp. TaxID=165185 RepID=UPI000E862962|nr:HAMP domain-containing sensor histidine kinase [uncultured Eubacterium sp.]HAH18167.1 sensor histidine kinase [Eubacterium sp.]HAV90245.1 sensor histidine kinase [Eubacterium sp.]
MNKFRRLIFVVIIFEILMIVSFNYYLFSKNNNNTDKEYKVQAERVFNEIKTNPDYADNPESINLSRYDQIVKVSIYSEEACNNDYVVKKFNDKYYRIEYKQPNGLNGVWYINIFIIIMGLSVIGILIYIYMKIIKPFYNMSNMTYELAKGNLTTPLKAEKSKFFGKFMWGMDMLRENLESNKQKELKLQKEKKTLLLSLSHDIKTPLSAIDLYTKALKENLYDTEEKKEEALEGILANVTSIKNYVNEINKISREDFLNLEVVKQEFYLQDVINDIEKYYKEKLSLLHTVFNIEEFNNVLLRGDSNRLIEVMQNLIENAIKYGDGKTITIAFADEEDCKLISVRNSGNTLDRDQLPNIFDSFYRGSNTDNIKGNGLGLYICKNLMKNMGGDIFVEIEENDYIAAVVVRKA